MAGSRCFVCEFYIDFFNLSVGTNIRALVSLKFYDEDIFRINLVIHSRIKLTYIYSTILFQLLIFTPDQFRLKALSQAITLMIL